VEPHVFFYPGLLFFSVTVHILTTDPVPPPPQVTWTYEPKEGERINIAVFHPNFEPIYPDSPVKGRVSFSPSPPNLDSPSIQIKTSVLLHCFAQFCFSIVLDVITISLCILITYKTSV
uniref:Uncharacterized protein n=1 Tax=Seriola dumerili TaxID=41447 RepID=A0A3B4T3Q7_SERDU